MESSEKQPAIPGLDTTIILTLLAKAATVWFNSHRGPFGSQEYLAFTAEYIATNYNKEAKNGT